MALRNWVVRNKNSPCLTDVRLFTLLAEDLRLASKADFNPPCKSECMLYC